MSALALGALVGEPLALHPHLVAATVRAAVERLGLADRVAVVEIDPAYSDTTALRDRYGLDPAALVNCVVVAGRRDGQERLAACLVPSARRVDVNGVVRRRLDVRKASFLPQADAVERTGMAYGAITPLGLPEHWPVLVDPGATGPPVVLVGSGVRESKLLLPGALLAGLPLAQVVAGLGKEPG